MKGRINHSLYFRYTFHVFQKPPFYFSLDLLEKQTMVPGKHILLQQIFLCLNEGDLIAGSGFASAAAMHSNLVIDLNPVSWV